MSQVHSNPQSALEEADFMARCMYQPMYLIDAGNNRIEVRASALKGERVLEVVHPPKLDTVTV